MLADTALTLAQARALAVAAQGLPGGEKAAAGVLNRVALMQMDPLTRVARAHHLTCAARLPGSTLLDGVDAQLWPAHDPISFETYTHAACIMPIDDWPLFETHRARARARTDSPPADARARVHRMIAASEDGLTVRELQQDDRTGGGWGWSVTKRAAEHMVWRGDLACTRRRRGERVLDLTERCVPDHLRDRTLTNEECIAALAERALTALGAATTEDIAAYHHLRTEDVANALTGLGRVTLTVQGWEQPAWVAGPPPDATTTDDPRMIGPFDTLIRDRARTRRLFDLDYVFEAYKPAVRRTYGAYVLAVLDGTALGCVS